MRSSTLLAAMVPMMLMVGCSKKVEEPTPAPRATTAPSAAPSSKAPLTPRERKEITYRLHNESCNEPLKHINVINGRKETDPAVLDLLSMCIDRGNMAWSRCVMAAKTNAEVDTCGTRLLIDAPR
jgi:hypothetical protein